MPNSRNVTVTIRTVFNYSPEAIDGLLSKYRGASQYSVLVECHFNPAKQQFVLEGDRKLMEYALCDFMGLLHKFNSDESRKPASNIMQRAIESLLNTQPIRWTDNIKSTVQPQSVRKQWNEAMVSSSDPQFEQTAGEQDYMFEYPLVEYWEPKATQEEFNSMLNLEGNPTIPQQLAQNYDCAVFPDWGRRNVKIGANDRKTLDSVFDKLRRVEEFFKRRFAPITVHLVNPEDKTKFQIRFVALSKQSVKERTTLFDNFSKWNTYPTEQFFTVRLMEYDYKENVYKACKLGTGTVSKTFHTPKHKDWIGYEFESHEASADYFSPSTNSTLEDIHDTRRIEPEDVICAYYPPKESAAAAAQIPADLSEQDESTMPPPKIEKATRRPRVKAFKDNESTATDSTKTNSLAGSEYSSDAESGYRPSDSDNVSYGSTEQIFEFGPPRSNQSDGSTTTSNVTRRAVQPQSNSSSHGRPLDSMSEDASLRNDNKHTGFIFGARPSNASQEPVASASVRRPRARESAYDTTSRNTVASEDGSAGFGFGARPSTAQVENRNEPSKPAMTTRTVRKPRERKPTIDHNGEESSSSAKAAVESVSEFQTRRTMRTLNQKKPGGKLGTYTANDLDNLRRHNAQRMNEALFNAFDNARGWAGEVKTEAKIGRLIYLDIPRSIVKKDIEWKQWDPLMNSPDTNFKSTFTRILTMQHWDMEFIRDMKVAGGERVFAEEPTSHKVIYEFDIEQKDKKRLLCVDGETFKPVLYGENQKFGAVNMANPLHSWDYRIDLVGKRPLALASNPFIKGIYDSLNCQGGKYPALTFIVNGPALSVRRVILKRETRYPVYLDRLHKGVPMELVATEVSELQLSRNKDVEKQYRACLLHEREMKQEQKLYWTCSIAPSETNVLLKENARLNVGETTDWTTEGILRLQPEGETGMLLPSLMNVLNIVVAKLDDVGSANNAFI